MSIYFEIEFAFLLLLFPTPGPGYNSLSFQSKYMSPICLGSFVIPTRELSEILRRPTREISEILRRSMKIAVCIRLGCVTLPHIPSLLTSCILCVFWSPPPSSRGTYFNEMLSSISVGLCMTKTSFEHFNLLEGSIPPARLFQVFPCTLPLKRCAAEVVCVCVCV